MKTRNLMNELSAATGNISIDPARSDLLYKALSSFSHGNPFFSGFIYFIISFVAVYGIGIATGQFHGKNGLPPMYSTTIDNLNMGILAPLGAGLLCHLYLAIRKALSTIYKEQLISPDKRFEYGRFLYKLDRAYNNWWVTGLVFLVSFSISLLNYFGKTTSWLSIKGGITGLYGRIFISLNFFMIGLIVYKCIVTVWGLHNILKLDIKVRPFHPDKAGGLRDIGRLAMSVNYFMTVILLFATLLLVFDPYARNNIIYPIILVFFYPISILSFFASLAGAHNKMLKVKVDVMHMLDNTFEHYYHKLTNSEQSRLLDVSFAQEILNVRLLYSVAEDMPVWPFDIRSLIKFFSAIMIPISIFLINMITNADSILYNIDKIRQFSGN